MILWADPFWGAQTFQWQWSMTIPRSWYQLEMEVPNRTSKYEPTRSRWCWKRWRSKETTSPPHEQEHLPDPKWPHLLSHGITSNLRGTLLSVERSPPSSGSQRPRGQTPTAEQCPKREEGENRYIVCWGEGFISWKVYLIMGGRAHMSYWLKPRGEGPKSYRSTIDGRNNCQLA